MGLGDWFRKRRTAAEATRATAKADSRKNDARVAAARETTRRSYVRVTVDAGGTELPPTASKLGGVPYVPAGAATPEGMFCIAQLNLAEVPAIDALPRTGIVQFWITDDDLYGMSFDRGVSADPGQRTIYHASIEAPQVEGIGPAGARGPLCFEDPYGRRLHFELKSELVPDGDYQWEPFCERHDIDVETELDEKEWLDASGHKIGGYCAFTQDDPRKASDPMWSLLQLDSDEHVFWGDTGLAHWFIREADLRACNFAKVRYSWDCC